jgi:hypothetical protein
MTPAWSNFRAGPLADRRAADLLLAWIDAADDAHEAYLAWRDADQSERTDAFVVYRAALDREEAAARALQAFGGRRGRTVR